jgi:hypothetical protein
VEIGFVTALETSFAFAQKLKQMKARINNMFLLVAIAIKLSC